MVEPAPALAEIDREARDRLAAAVDERALEEWRTRTLGRSGALTAVLRSLGTLDPDQRRELGQAANALKGELEAALESRREELRIAQLSRRVRDDAIDVTLPGRKPRRGGLHPITQTLREILAVFTRLGYATVEGPEVESGEYNFDRSCTYCRPQNINAQQSDGDDGARLSSGR